MGKQTCSAAFLPRGTEGPPHHTLAQPGQGPASWLPAPRCVLLRSGLQSGPLGAEGAGGGNAEELLGVLDPALVRARGVPWKGVESSVS